MVTMPSNLEAGAHQRGPIPRPGEVFDPVARALDRIGDKWTLVLVRHLLGGPVGFQHLRARTGITARVLSARLRQLAAAGLIETVSGENGRSRYAVTAKGRELEPIIAALARWYVHHPLHDPPRRRARPRPAPRRAPPARRPPGGPRRPRPRRPARSARERPALEGGRPRG